MVCSIVAKNCDQGIPGSRTHKEGLGKQLPGCSMATCLLCRVVVKLLRVTCLAQLESTMQRTVMRQMHHKS